MSQIQQAFVVNGQIFNTKADAERAIRQPLVLAELDKLTKSPELSKFLEANEDSIEAIFDTGTIRRVTKAEHNKLEKAVAALKLVEGKEIAFLRDNAEAVLESFRWPAQKRLKPEEKAAEVQSKLMDATEQNAELTAWIIANQAALMQAYKAGVVKREVPESAKAGLAAFQAKRKAEKEAEEAAKAEGPEAYETFKAQQSARRAAEAEAAANAASATTEATAS